MSYRFSLTNKCSYEKERNILVDYTPVFNIQLQQKLNIFPIFNDDHQVTTPGFIIEYEKVLLIQFQPAYQTNLKYHQQLFDEKIQQTKIKNKQLVCFVIYQLIPKPKHRVLICSVCRSNYTDYLTVRNIVHKKLFSLSPYLEKIKQIQEELNVTHSNQTDFDETQLVDDNPRKKIKTDIISNYLNS